VGLWQVDDQSGRQRWKIARDLDGERFIISVLGGVSGGRRYLSISDDFSTLNLWGSDDGSGRQKWHIPGWVAHVAIKGSMTVQNLDYAALQTNSYLSGAVKEACKSAVDASAGASACEAAHQCKTHVELSEGSVRVAYRMIMPSHKAPTAFTGLKANLDSMGANLAEDLSGIHGLEAAITGELSVTAVETPVLEGANSFTLETSAPTTAPTTAVPVVEAPTQGPTEVEAFGDDLIEEEPVWWRDWRSISTAVLLVGGTCAMLCCFCGTFTRKRIVYIDRDWLSPPPEQAIGDPDIDGNDPSAPMIEPCVYSRGPVYGPGP
jgi:hypothetical protein